jgi:hypothetical protein
VRNVTVPLDDATDRWLLVEAAKRRTTVSALIKKLLREEMRQQSATSSALRRYASRPPVSMLADNSPDELRGRDGRH